ncbi:MAG: tetratricopeptide repeat protein, partial [Candidatus Eremiobacteraeota bacterium]|nr:tetratricopeptide repeat protein [Candidatus Eremiobacteraeota bacterium]
KEAVKAFQKALEEEPENLDVRGYIIGLSLKSGDWPEVVNQHLQCADTFISWGDWESAADRYHEILRLEKIVQAGGSGGLPGDMDELRATIARVKPDVCLKLGRYYLHRQNHDQAVSYLRTSLELWPGRWEAHQALGQLYFELLMDREAIDQLQEVSRLAPNEAASAYELLGHIFARRDSARPGHPGVWFRLASELYVKRQEPEAAVQALLRGVEAEPGNSEVLYALSDLYKSLGRFAEAEEYEARGDRARTDGTDEPQPEPLFGSSAGEPNPFDDLFGPVESNPPMKTKVHEFVQNLDNDNVDWTKATLKEDGYLWTSAGDRLTDVQYAFKTSLNPNDFLVGDDRTGKFDAD